MCMISVEPFLQSLRVIVFLFSFPFKWTLTCTETNNLKDLIPQSDDYFLFLNL